MFSWRAKAAAVPTSPWTPSWTPPPAYKKRFCFILQVFSSLVVNLTYPTLIRQLSCICHLQERHALCPQYRAILDIADGVTLFPRAASSVVDGGTRETASCGHQTRAPGRRTSSIWMLRDMNTSPGHQAAVPTGHT